MNSWKNIVIDLSNSFTLAEHYALADAIIEIDSDESLDSTLEVTNTEKSNGKTSKKKKKDTSPVSQIDFFFVLNIIRVQIILFSIHP